MSKVPSPITFTIMALISIVLPIALALLFYPELFQSTDPEKLGCEGPLAGLGLFSGILMASQMRLAISEYKVLTPYKLRQKVRIFIGSQKA